MWINVVPITALILFGAIMFQLERESIALQDKAEKDMKRLDSMMTTIHKTKTETDSIMKEIEKTVIHINKLNYE